MADLMVAQAVNQVSTSKSRVLIPLLFQETATQPHLLITQGLFTFAVAKLGQVHPFLDLNLELQGFIGYQSLSRLFTLILHRKCVYVSIAWIIYCPYIAGWYQKWINQVYPLSCQKRIGQQIHLPFLSNVRIVHLDVSHIRSTKGELTPWHYCLLSLYLMCNLSTNYSLSLEIKFSN